MSSLLGGMGAGLSMADTASTVAEAGAMSSAGNAATLAMTAINMQQQLTAALSNVMNNAASNIATAARKT